MSLGTDPEVFVLNTNGTPVPAWRFFPPKENKVLADDGQGSFFRDGYALELNTAPQTCRAYLGNHLRTTLKEAIAKLPKGYSVTTAATVKVNLKDMADAPPDCQVFGCDPSQNAYTEQDGVVDLDAMTHGYRYAGGHMHQSFVGERRKTAKYTGKSPIDSDPDSYRFIKLCDLFIGVPLAYLFDSQDEVQRRQYYGRAGEFRFQTYNGSTPKLQGLEYRVPSPKLWNNHRLATMMFGVFRAIATGYSQIANDWKHSWDEPVQMAINHCKVPFKMLQTVSGIYTPEVLKKLKEEKMFEEQVFHKEVLDCHTAWTEFLKTHAAFSTNTVDIWLGYVKRSYGMAPSGQYHIRNLV